MEPEAGWKALQSHLKAARAARDAGALDQAREHLDAALAIDPNFLAAQVLRESVSAPGEFGSDVAQAFRPAGRGRPEGPQSTRTDDTLEPELWISPSPLPASHVSLEERARLRRIDHCIDAAESAMIDRRLPDAAEALDEVAELAPDTPALNALAAELALLRRDTRRTHRGVWVAAAVVVVAALVAAWPRQPKPASLVVRRTAGSATLVTPPKPVLSPEATPSFFETTPRADAQTTGGTSAPGIPTVPDVRPPVPDDVPAQVAERGPALPALPKSVTVTLAAAAALPPPGESPAGPAAAPVTMVDDSALIRETLERYRRAYNGLDARLAHAVYPGVDLSALERAFEELRSQSLQFDVCSFDVRGESARATCRGSARYVPKIGSREPRAERRVWTFRLDKNDRDWKIASAWADR